MGLVKEIVSGIKNLIGDNPNQYVIGKDGLDNELIIAMNQLKLASKDAALLSKTAKDADQFATSIDERQKNGIVLYMSDKVIRAGNWFEELIKKSIANKKIANKLNNNPKSTELPKDYMVTTAEAVNGKIPTRAAGELENNPRIPGGRGRESRIK